MAGMWTWLTAGNFHTWDHHYPIAGQTAINRKSYLGVRPGIMKLNLHLAQIGSVVIKKNWRMGEWNFNLHILCSAKHKLIRNICFISSDNFLVLKYLTDRIIMIDRNDFYVFNCLQITQDTFIHLFILCIMFHNHIGHYACPYVQAKTLDSSL